jgi:hypothetical protein
MKIYVNSYNPIDMLEKIKKIDANFSKSTKYIEIVSNYGLYKIENNNLFKLHAVDYPVQILKQFYKNVVLFIDKSYFKSENIYSQIPPEHEIRDVTCFYYEVCDPTLLSKKKKNDYSIQLVVEGTYKENEINLQTNSNNSNNKYYRYVPHDFYFLVNDNFHFENYFCKEVINEFLSQLF